MLTICLKTAFPRPRAVDIGNGNLGPWLPVG